MTNEPSALLADAERLRRDVDSLRNAQSTARQIEELEGSHAAIKGAVADLQRFSDFLAAVREDKAVEVPARRLTPIIQAAQNLADEPDADRLPEAARTLNQQLATARDVLRERAGEVWLEFTSGVRIGDQRSLFEALAVVPALKERCQDLAERAAALEAQLASTSPPGAASYRMTKRALKELEEEVAALQIGEFPALLVFLERSVRGEVTLADLIADPRLLEWIRQQGLESHFLVRPGRPLGPRT